MSYETVIYEASNHVATITLNRPERLNAITKELELDLLEAMQAADQSDEVRVIIFVEKRPPQFVGK